MQIVVTRLENIQQDEDGKFLTDEDGGLLLHDEEDVGVLAKTHVVPVTQAIDGAIHTGVSSLCEVYWNKHRTPAPALVAPTEIAWLTVGEDEGEEVEDEGEGEEYDDQGFDHFDESPGHSFSEQ